MPFYSASQPRPCLLYVRHKKFDQIISKFYCNIKVVLTALYLKGKTDEREKMIIASNKCEISKELVFPQQIIENGFPSIKQCLPFCSTQR